MKKRLDQLFCPNCGAANSDASPNGYLRIDENGNVEQRSYSCYRCGKVLEIETDLKVG